jgi:hypothetical protein
MKAQERETLRQALKARFKAHMHRHTGITWADEQARLDARPDALQPLHNMEATGGEPDVIGRNKQTDSLTFCDCSAESLSGRRSVCYDAAALDSRKENKPADRAVALAAAMGGALFCDRRYGQVFTYHNGAQSHYAARGFRAGLEV